MNNNMPTGKKIITEKIKKLLLLLLKVLMIYIYDLYLVLFFGQFTNPLLWEKIIVVISLLWNSSFTHVKCSLFCFSAISIPVSLYHGKKAFKICYYYYSGSHVSYMSLRLREVKCRCNLFLPM